LEKHRGENVEIRKLLNFSHNVWLAAYDVIWSASTKLSIPRAFRLVVIAVVAVIIASFFFAVIIIAMRQAVGTSSLGDIVLILLVGLRPTGAVGVYDVRVGGCGANGSLAA
jgi:hypothetical protein